MHIYKTGSPGIPGIEVTLYNWRKQARVEGITVPVRGASFTVVRTIQAVSIPREETHLTYHWNGAAITAVLKKSRLMWCDKSQRNLNQQPGDNGDRQRLLHGQALSRRQGQWQYSARTAAAWSCGVLR